MHEAARSETASAVAADRLAGADEVGTSQPVETVALAPRIVAEQLRLLYKPFVPLAVNMVNAVIVGAVLWPRLPHAAVALWLAAMALVVLGRAMLRRIFWSRAGDRPGPGWGHAFAVGAGLTGVLWGSMAFAIPLIEAPLYDMLIGVVAAGMCAGAVASLSMHLPAFYAFLLPCLVPFAVVFLTAADIPHRGLGAMAVVFLAALVFMARGSNSALVEILRLRFRNADLVQKLSVTRDMAEQASRSNWETLAHLSHELRTPLNAIGGFAELMCRRTFGPLGHGKYDEYAKDIRDSAMHLTNLVEEILLYSRGHTGTLRLDEANIDVGAEIDGCVQMVRQSASEAGVGISVNVSPTLPRLRGDPVKLRQIVLNLLSNAVKFTPAGGHVTVSARTDAARAILITVADTGIGIERADLPRVLEPYVQLESAFLRKRQSGLGLGLPLVKRLVELHGGALTLESEVGRGTTAIVYFPPERTIDARAVPPT